MLTALARGKRVVPVIGEALQTLPDENGQPVPFVRLLAWRMMRSLPADEQAKVLGYLQKKQPFASASAEPSLHDLAVAPSFYKRPASFADALRPLHEELLGEAMAHIFPATEPPVEQRHPLRLLAEIRNFPLYLNTTPDSLMKRVLARVRELRDEDVRGFQLVRDTPKRATTADVRADFAWDLPPGWEPSPTARPFLFHLFGRIDDPDGGARFDVTEEDHFEMLCRLQSESWCPQQLIWELKPAHILLLGQPLADWHARFFVRLLRGQRLSAPEEPTTETLVDSLYKAGPEPPHYTSLAVFLDTFSEDTRIYRDGDPEQFVRQLHEKWGASQAQAVTFTAASEPPPPADLANDGVFISYQSKDAAAAERLAEDLRAAGVKTYLDKSRARDATQPGLQPGSKWAEKLEQNVKQAIFSCRSFPRTRRRAACFGASGRGLASRTSGTSACPIAATSARSSWMAPRSPRFRISRRNSRPRTPAIFQTDVRSTTNNAAPSLLNSSPPSISGADAEPHRMVPRDLQLTPEAPWPGPAPYAERDAGFFHGRAAETAEMHRLVHAEPVSVLYALSGLGKTSLLRAGVFPRLRAEGWLPVRIRLDHRDCDDDGHPVPPLPAQVLAPVAGAAMDCGVAVPEWDAEKDTLADAFHARGGRFWGAHEEAPVTPRARFRPVRRMLDAHARPCRCPRARRGPARPGRRAHGLAWKWPSASSR